MAGHDIPVQMDELTPEWLTEALHSRGLLGDARVMATEIRTLGDGEGFMGELARVTLELDRDEPKAPRTLIAKLPTHRPKNRALGELLGAYQREILVYEELAPGLPIRTPRVYYADMDTSTTAEYESRGAAMMDRWPMWLIGPMMSLATWIAGRRKRRYILLIEDLSAGEIGDQIIGCTAEQSEQILRGIAHVHALHWGSRELEELFYLQRLDVNPKTLQKIFLRGVGTFRETNRVEPDSRMGELLSWMERHGVTIVEVFGRSAPHTLQHCDLRLDNVFFFPTLAEDESHSEPIALFDWQLAGRGPGVFDVAYFLSGALDKDTPPSTVQRLLRCYHDELLASGVSDYDFEACRRDYYRSLPIIMQRIASADAVDVGEDRGAELMKIWAERLVSRLDDVELNSLLQ